MNTIAEVMEYLKENRLLGLLNSIASNMAQTHKDLVLVNTLSFKMPLERANKEAKEDTCAYYKQATERYTMDLLI